MEPVLSYYNEGIYQDVTSPGENKKKSCIVMHISV